MIIYMIRSDETNYYIVAAHEIGYLNNNMFIFSKTYSELCKAMR
jgi:hypothetical protein